MRTGTEQKKMELYSKYLHHKRQNKMRVVNTVGYFDIFITVCHDISFLLKY